jgi:hypothetical protein
MGSEEAKKKYPDEKQRYAVALSEFKRKKDYKNDGSFVVKAPITKFWQQEVDVVKGSGKTEKANERFIEVTVSGLKEDRDGEMMSQKAIDHMVMQFKSGTIPFFPDHGRDEKTGQPQVYSWKSMMGVWVDARQENDKLKAVVRLNSAHPDHEQFWQYIEKGMPIGFSIGGKPMEAPELIESEEVEMAK